MASNRLRKFRTVDEVQVFLNGGIQGSTLQKAQGGGTPANLGVGVNGLVGTTLTFYKPAATTVTFATCGSGSGGSADPTTTPPGTNPDPYTLIFKDIKLQIETAVAGVKVSMYDGALVIQETTPTGGVGIRAGSSGGFPVVVGTVDLRTLSYGSGGSVDTLTLVVHHTAGGPYTVTFAAPANQGAIVTQINAVLVAHGITASINGANQLVLTANDQGASVSIVINSGTALTALGLTAGTYSGAATNTANALLGFDASNDTSGLLYSPVEVSNSPPCWTWAYSGNDNMHNIYTWE